MSALRYPAPESWRTRRGLTVHRWKHSSPTASPVLLIHGFASNALFNWVKTGWLDPLSALNRDLICVDLPGHGASREVNPAGLRMAHLIEDLHELVGALGTPVAAHGYSLGSRIAWQFAYDHPDDVESLVMGGSPVSDEVYQVHPEQARRWAAGGPEPEDEATRKFITVAAALPDQHLQHVVELRLSLAHDVYAPSATVPQVPTLVVAGDRDTIAEGADALADLVASHGNWSDFVSLPGRNHVNALTARTYKGAVVAFLTR